MTWVALGSALECQVSWQGLVHTEYRHPDRAVCLSAYSMRKLLQDSLHRWGKGALIERGACVRRFPGISV
jgi:hypothetical protein